MRAVFKQLLVDIGLKTKMWKKDRCSACFLTATEVNHSGDK